MTVKLLYFAWVRERIGLAEEVREVPPTCLTIADLIGWLKTQGAEYESAFARAQVIRSAIDQCHAPSTAAIAGAREIAFFPPVTGG
jgi:sulfur-carrier protein